MGASVKFSLAVQILIFFLELNTTVSMGTLLGGGMARGSVGGAGPTSGLNSLFHDPSEPDNTLSSDATGNTGDDRTRDRGLDTDQSSQSMQSGSEDGMDFLRGSEKDFMLSAKGVNVGFPSRADMKAGQPDMRYAMDLSSPSPSSSSPILESRAHVQSMVSKPAERKRNLPGQSRFEKLVESQRDWWSQLRGAKA